MESNLEIKTAIQIYKPAGEIFEAIVNPDKMCQYFIAESSGTMQEGKEVIWKFPEMEMRFPVEVHKIIKNKYISFYWQGDDGKPLLVEINLEEVNATSTIVRITEKSRENNEAGIAWLRGNTEGWANFLACLKAYLEYEINLRKGAFDFIMIKNVLINTNYDTSLQKIKLQAFNQCNSCH